MPTEAIDAVRSLFDRRRGRNVRRPKLGGLFWWTVLIVFQFVVMALSWFFSVYIFNHPEQPLPYRILAKVDKLVPPIRFRANADPYPPEGKFLPARALYEKYYNFNDPDIIAAKNKLLLRDYIRNYKGVEKIDYTSGLFEVSQVRQLGPGDLIISGAVIRARCIEYPKVSIEFILPSTDPKAARRFKIGDQLDLSGSQKGKAFAAVVNLQRLEGDRMCLGLIPLVYEPYRFPEGEPLRLEPPLRLNIEGRWPLTSDDGEPPAEFVE